MTRRIKQINGASGIVELQNGRRNRNTALFFQLHPIRGDLALLTTSLHSASLLNRTSIQQELLGERGFSSIWVGNNRKIATSRHSFSKPILTTQCIQRLAAFSSQMRAHDLAVDTTSLTVNGRDSIKDTTDRIPRGNDHQSPPP